jgi:hypothetical protein
MPLSRYFKVTGLKRIVGAEFRCRSFLHISLFGLWDY